MWESQNTAAEACFEMVLFELITIGKPAKSILGSKAIYMFINRLNFSELLYLYTYHVMACFPS